VWQAAWYDLHDGFTTLIHSFIEENKAMFSQQRAIHIVLVLIMVRPVNHCWDHDYYPLATLCPDHTYAGPVSGACSERIDVQLPVVEARMPNTFLLDILSISKQRWPLIAKRI
jgi:hypothetical protein